MQQKIIETIKSILLSYVLTIVCLLLLALLVYQCDLKNGVVNVSIICIYIISCFAGAFRLGKKNMEKRFLWGLLLGLCYILLLILASLLVNHGVHLTSTTNITAVLLCLFSGMLGGMVS